MVLDHARAAVIPALPDAIEANRSPHWPEMVRGFLAEYPRCAGCERKADTAHHVKPFHLFPDLELVEGNLVAVCLPCHFVLCHLGDWRTYLETCRSVLKSHRRLVRIAKS